MSDTVGWSTPGEVVTALHAAYAVAERLPFGGIDAVAPTLSAISQAIAAAENTVRTVEPVYADAARFYRQTHGLPIIEETNA